VQPFANQAAQAIENARLHEQVQRHVTELEKRVAERTAELDARVTEVEQLNLGMTNLLEDLKLAHRKTEATAAKLQAVNQELEDFAYVISHDLKAPLRGISQLAGWLSTDYGDALDEDGKEIVQLLINRTKRMHSLIEGVLQYSRIGRVTEAERKVDLNPLVQEIIEMLNPPEYIQITVEDKLPTVVGERVRLEQVFQNLLSNAIKFIDKPEGWVRINCESEETGWLFRVTDNGPGIEKKYHARLFQMFQTLAPRDRFESTGVGLALVKKIVQTWEGSVWVESTVGKGSTFHFTLPKKGKNDEKQ
jgi:light-regulated signal transduction histidine kinase (bacteriophytochrome)